MQIFVNGENQTIADSATVADLLKQLQVEARYCAVECNREVLARENHAGHTLREGDRVEIVTLVGGG